MKNQFLPVVIALCGLFFSNISCAQESPACDTLVLKSGIVIPARVTQVKNGDVRYTACDQTGGAQNLVYWSDLKEIRYTDGRIRTVKGETKPLAPGESTWMVETTDDNTYIGTIKGQDNNHIMLETKNLGTINILRANIRKMDPLRPEQVVNGEIWFESPHDTRYYFGPNGYSLHRGEAYYQNAWILFNQISVGVTDRFTVGLGIMPLFLFQSATPVWITPKFSFPIEKDRVNMGVGALLATVLGEDGGGSFGVVYGQLTLGSRDKNINFGLGYGYAGESWAEAPTISVSAMYRGSKKFAFITENYLFDTGYDKVGLISAGGRFLGRRIAIDGALALPIVSDFDFIGIPWLGINVPIGKK